VSQPLLAILFGAIFVNNILLMRFLGLCPFFGVSTRFSTAIGMSSAVLFVMTFATWITWGIYQLVLVPGSVLLGGILPQGLVFLRTVSFILVIAALVQLVEMFLKKTVPVLYSALGIYLPLITTNCAIPGRGVSCYRQQIRLPSVHHLRHPHRVRFWPGHDPVCRVA
jgi:electron transport complex protein RnfA